LRGKWNWWGTWHGPSV